MASFIGAQAEAQGLIVGNLDPHLAPKTETKPNGAVAAMRQAIEEREKLSGKASKRKVSATPVGKLPKAALEAAAKTSAAGAGINPKSEQIEGKRRPPVAPKPGGGAESRFAEKLSSFQSLSGNDTRSREAAAATSTLEDRVVTQSFDDLNRMVESFLTTGMSGGSDKFVGAHVEQELIVKNARKFLRESFAKGCAKGGFEAGAERLKKRLNGFLSRLKTGYMDQKYHPDRKLALEQLFTEAARGILAKEAAKESDSGVGSSREPSPPNGKEI